MPGTLDLVSIAEGLLAETVRWFTDVAEIDLPERRCIAPGNPQLIAWDCPQLVVSCSGTNLGVIESLAALPSSQAGGQAGMQIRYAVYAVALVRCTPVPDEGGNPPSSAVLHAAGLAALRDCGALSQMAADIAAFPTDHGRAAWLPLPAQIRAGAVTQIGPSGDLTGYQLDFTATTTRVV